MNVDNIERAVALSRSLENVNDAIEGAEKMLDAVKSGISGMLLKQHSDGSGAFNITDIYIDGNYPKATYTKIAQVALDEFKALKAEIEKEIETL